MADTKKGMAIKTTGTETVAIVSGTNTIGVSGGTNVFAVSTGTNVVTIDGGTNTLSVDGGTNVFAVSTGTNVVTIDGGTNVLSVDGGTNVFAVNTGTNVVTIDGGTNTLTVEGGTNVFSVSTGTNVVAIDSGTNVVTIGGTNTINVSTGTNVAKTALWDGTNQASIDTNGALKVEGSITVIPEVVTLVNKYGTASVTNTGTLTLSHTVTSGKTFIGHVCSAGGAEACYATLTLEDGTNVTNALTFFSQAGLTIQQKISGVTLVGDGTKLVKLTLTNIGETDNFYPNFQGEEKA